MDPKELREILKLLRSYDVSEFELEEEGRRIFLRRPAMNDGFGVEAGVPISMTQPGVVLHAPVVAPSHVASQNQANTAPPSSGEVAQQEDGHIIVAPMVGTFYRAPSPDSDPFIEVGAAIQAGDTLCIIEAMKLMNEIDADVAGVVTEVFVENGTPVEYGAKLFRIEPKGA